MARVRPNCQSLLIATPAPCSTPKTTNSEVRPCHTPIKKKVTKKHITARNGCIANEETRRISANSSGLNTYVLSQVERVMCHRFQKSRNEEAENGRSKFSGRRTLMSRATAITMSMYPEKFEYKNNGYTTANRLADNNLCDDGNEC